MGRIYRTFTAKANGKKIRRKGLIDTGADRTVVDFQSACSLGLDTTHATIASGRVFDGREIKGYEMSVEIRLGDKKARVMAFVPRDGASSIVGHDFLQKAKVKIDYGTEPHQLSGGGLNSSVALAVRRERNPKVIARLRQASCPVPRRRRRR